MRIVITGANGFVGRALRRQLAGHDLVCLDSNLNGGAGIKRDIRDRRVLEATFSQGCDAVVHLATIPGGAAEANPPLAWEVNVGASRDLIECAAAAGNCPRFVFASSIAVFGELPNHVDDLTPPAPRMLYGAHKAIIEQWLETRTRRGAVSGVSLRLPGIVARPKAPSGMKSAFMSDVFHDILSGTPISLPVSRDATLWLMSMERVVANMAHAIGGDETGIATLPTLRCTMGDLVAEIARAANRSVDAVAYAPDKAIEAAFGRHPPLRATRAEHWGYSADEDLEVLVRSALATLSSGAQ